MRYNFLFLLCLLLSSQSYTQECGTSLTDYDKKIIQKLIFEEDSSRSPNVKSFAVSIHILNKNTTTDIEYADILFKLEEFNNLIASTGFEFVSCDAYYINDVNFGIINIGANAEELHAKYGIPGTINIYFVQDVQDFCGFSSFPWFNPENQRIFVQNSCLQGGTLAHELGHFFGLLHTHETAFGVELVNRSNCNTNGDVLCDTQADPRLGFHNVTFDCQYNGIELDANLIPYNPDPTNLMSYSRPNCRDTLSSQQLSRMRMFMLDSQLAEENCLGPDFSLDVELISSNSQTEEAEIRFGDHNHLKIKVNHSGIRSNTASSIIISLLNDAGEALEINRFNTLSIPGRSLTFDKKIWLPNIHQTGYDRLLLEIDPENVIEEHDELNNTFEIAIRNDFNNGTKANFFPNPSTDFISAFFTTSENQLPVDIYIYNQMGQLVKSEKGIEIEGDEYFYSLKIESFIPGVYFARFEWSNDKTQVLRFVKI